MKFRKTLALICSLALAGTVFTGCDDDYTEYDDTSVSDSDSDSSSVNRLEEGTSSQENLSGDITVISRTRRENCVPMGPEGTWSIFVYLCGTDLESEAGMASGDIDEMLAVSGNSDIKFIVQTGGTKSWEKNISSDKIERYEICNGEMKLVDSVSRGNMGDSKVLADFINWGVTEYPAARNGLVLWNHGGGSISGVCFDEYTDDSLSLREIDAALYSTREAMTDDFEFIGFDACLMGTVETASILASHARYMIGSEELEPGAGWVYSELGNYLVSNPNADGKELGKAICDSYFSACKADGDDGEATLSVIDLSKIDNAIIKFRQFAEDLYNSTENTESLSEFVRNVKAQENYGGNSFWEGYSNMVDMKGVVEAGSSYSSHAAEAKQAIENAVVYKKNGQYHSGSCGLSMYYPLQADGSSEIKIFKDICISTHYLAFVDRILYGASNGTIDTYNSASGILDSFINWGSDFLELEEDDETEYYVYDEDSDDDFWSSFWSDWDDYDEESGDFEPDFDVDPYLDDDGTFGFVLSEDSLNETSSVYAYVYMISDDYEDLIDLGITSDIIVDWNSGTVTDNFDGYWFSLDDGQPLAVYLLEEGDGYDIFTSPIYLNDEETNIRFCWDYEKGDVYILGIWNGIDDNGCADRNCIELEKGDVIVPRYQAYAIDSDDEYEYYGSEYVYSGDDCLSFEYLLDGEYLYAFGLDDVFGNSYISDFINFTVDGEDIYFDDLSD